MNTRVVWLSGKNNLSNLIISIFSDFKRGKSAPPLCSCAGPALRCLPLSVSAVLIERQSRRASCILDSCLYLSAICNCFVADLME